MYQSARTLRVFGEVVAREREERAQALWYAEAEERVMELLRGSLLLGARELSELGANVEVSESSSPAHETCGRCSRSLSVRYAKSEVMVYSVRTASSLSVHLAWVMKAPRARFARLLSIPGCAVRCGGNREPILPEVGPFAGHAAVELEQVAWRLLGMLGNSARARQRRTG